MNTQPELDLACDPVMELDEGADWPMPAGGAITWPSSPRPAPSWMLALTSIGAGLAGALMGMVKP